MAAHELEQEVTPAEPFAFQSEAGDWESLGNFERALEATQRAVHLDPSCSTYHFDLGECLTHLGQPEKAFEEFRLAAQLYPREAYIALRLGFEWIRRGKLSEGLSAHLEGLEWHPESVALLRSIDEDLRWITPARSRELDRRILKALAASKTMEEPETRILARLISAELITDAEREEALPVLAQVFRGFQDAEAATGGLEVLLSAADRLAGRLKAAGLDLAHASFPAEDRISSLLFEGWLLERDRKHDVAAARFAEAARLDPESVAAPWLLARCLAAAGDPAPAQAALRERIGRGAKPGRETRPLWDLWVTVGLQDLDCEPSAIRAKLPDSTGDAYREDLLWLLERLVSGEIVRIRCGGDEYRDPLGNVWSRDRFFAGGRDSDPVLEEIEGTDADPLYHGGRSFRGEEMFFAGYRFPVAAGRYRVRLHFAETYLCLDRERTFDVALQGESILEDFEPARGGFLTAQVKEFLTTVEEGVLEIRFRPRNGGAKVSAIEIEKVE